MKNNISGRKLPGIVTIGLGTLLLVVITFTLNSCNSIHKQRPNLIYVFADQWRAQATGYMGNQSVMTPNIDKLAKESINFTMAISNCPVCSPYRASLMTGQYPLTNGVFHNDKPLSNSAITIAEVYRDAGYNTAYIGKWHLNGRKKDESVGESRRRPVPKDRRQGFDFWKVHECTHDYNHSVYYDENNQKHIWDGYDAIAQTKEAIRYIKEHKNGKPFILFLSWGPPHSPYQTAPEKYKQIYKDKSKIILRPNVPEEFKEKALTDISGYYAHITALDECVGEIMEALKQNKLEKNTILVFTADHGDMLYSHGKVAKQKPWDESIRVPFLLRYPRITGKKGRKIDMPIGAPDIMPTLLGLSNIDIPETVEGTDYSDVIRGKQDMYNEAVLIMCPVPFHQWNYHNGGKEYRGIRTRRYTYVEDLNGPWLLYDNQEDPYQMKNLVNEPDYAQLQGQLKKILTAKLKENKDDFLPGPEYMKIWGYQWDGNEAPDK